MENKTGDHVGVDGFLGRMRGVLRRLRKQLGSAAPRGRDGRRSPLRAFVLLAGAVVAALVIIWDFTDGGLMRELTETYLLMPELSFPYDGAEYLIRTYQVRWARLAATVVVLALAVGLAWWWSLRRARRQAVVGERARLDKGLAAEVGGYLAAPGQASPAAAPDSALAALPELAAEIHARKQAFLRREEDAAEAARARAAVESAGLLRSFMAADADADPKAHFGDEFTELAAEAVVAKTAIERREHTLRDEAQRKNDLITYLAHDLKTPLTSVLGYLGLLVEAPDLPAEQRIRYTGVALDKAQRLERLINEFFDITRYNLQDVVLERQEVDLGLLFEQMAEEFHPILEGHGNTLELDVPAGLAVSADAEKLARVFNNILRNAVFYSDEGTSITVHAQSVPPVGLVGAGVGPQGALEGPCLRVSVTDVGRTVPAHKLTSLFEKFFRLDDARATNTGGAGLGLAIARQIVEAHGGTIEAASSAGATTFTVVLPV